MDDLSLWMVYGFNFEPSQQIIINIPEYYVEKDSEAISRVSKKNIAWLAGAAKNLGEDKGSAHVIYSVSTRA